MIMEGDSHSPSAAASASVVVIAFDATKERSVKELKATIDGVRGKGDILSPGDRLVFLGVLDKVPHPMGYQVKACPDSFAGASIRVMEEEVIKKVDIYVNKLSKSAGVCVDERVCVEVTMAAGTPPKQVVLQEVATFNAAWLILDSSSVVAYLNRHLKRDLKFYLAQIPCKVALIHDDLSVEVERDHTRNVSDVTEQKTFYATSRHVPILDYQGYRNSRQSVIPCINYPLSGDSVNDSKWGMDRNNSPAISISTNQGGSGQVSCVPEAEVQHHAESQIIRRQISDIFRQRSSEEPILCSICGIRTDLNVKESMRFSISEIQLATDNFSVTNLLGEGGYGHVYKGRLHGGQFIAAKVHKEESAQGFSEFQSEVGDFGLARWKTIDPVHTRLLGTLGYLAPEYVESGCISVRTDVYAFGVILLQLISGRKVIDAKQLEGQQSIREWAVPLIEELALHKLIDPRLGESYDTYELYQMAKAAYLCVQRNPEKRPSAGQVLSLLEGKDDHMQHFRDHFDPSYSSL
ncbi:Inactive protein kinase SELMODRAFT_444075 [Linum perenne]